MFLGRTLQDLEYCLLCKIQYSTPQHHITIIEEYKQRWQKLVLFKNYSKILFPFPSYLFYIIKFIMDFSSLQSTNIFIFIMNRFVCTQTRIKNSRNGSDTRIFKLENWILLIQKIKIIIFFSGLWVKNCEKYSF